jgi:hypothetical protein
MAPGHSPGRGRGGSPPGLPRGVCFSVQPADLSGARDALLPFAPGGGRNAAIDLREPGRVAPTKADQAHSSEDAPIRAWITCCRASRPAVAATRARGPARLIGDRYRIANHSRHARALAHSESRFMAHRAVMTTSPARPLSFRLNEPE